MRHGNKLYLMAGEPEIADAILDCITNVYLGMNKRMFEASKGKLDICYMGDDYGTQQGMMMSPNTWRKLIKPHLGRLYAQAKEYGLVTIHHSCGGIVPIIEQLDNAITDKTCENIEAMAREAQATGIQVAIGSIRPVCRPSWYPLPEFIERKNTQIVDANARLKDISDNIDAAYIDYHSSMLDDRGWLRSELAEDGVHPHSAGYAIL